VRVAAASLLANLAERPTTRVKTPAAAAVDTLPADLQAEAAPVRCRDDAVLAQTGISEVLDQAGNIATQVNASIALADLPQVIAKDVSVIRFNPTEDGVVIVKGDTNNALARAANGQIDIFPNGLNKQTAKIMGTNVDTMYQQRIWHEMGHNYATENVKNIDANGRFAEAVKLDGAGNVPSPYGGTNLAEDFAKTLRLYVASNGGKDGLYDMMYGRSVAAGELRERFPNRTVVMARRRPRPLPRTNRSPNLSRNPRRCSSRCRRQWTTDERGG
jgi:hypothetical protein